MKNQTTNTAENTIVAFHIGRGGRFWNAGHRTFLGQNKISNYTGDLSLDYDVSGIVNKLESEIEDWDGEDTGYDSKYYLTNKDLFFTLLNDENWSEIEKIFGIAKDKFPTREYFDGAGNKVGLTEEESESGIGIINIDHEYNTTYTCKLSDCSNSELKAIRENEREFGYLNNECQKYVKEMLGEDENEDSE